LETTFFSYLVSRPSRDLLVAAHQQATQDWWLEQRERFECYVSQIVLDEASAGDAELAKRRLEVVSRLAVLEITDEVESLARAILTSGVIPAQAVRDAAPIAVAVVHA
jgi:hypothetical protein